MQVKRTRRSSKRRSRDGIRRGHRPMEQVRKLRIWMTLLALAATAAAVLLMLYFWQQFSQPYRQLEEQNAASSVAPVIVCLLYTSRCV